MAKPDSKPRTRRSLAEIATLIKRLEHSHGTVAEFAAEIGVAIPTIYSWKRRLQGAPSQRREPNEATMVRVIARPEAPRPNSKIDIELPSGLTCSVSPDFDEATLLRLIAIL